MKRKISRIITYLFVFVIFILFSLSQYIKIYFNNISFDQLLYTLNTVKGTSVDAISGGIKYVGISTLIFGMIVVIYIVFCINDNYNYIVKLKMGRYDKDIKIFPFNKIIKRIIILMYAIIFIWLSINNLHLYDYFKMQFSYSEIFEQYYVNPKNVDIKFPKKKKNLIHIYVESLEMTNVSKKNGGLVEKSYIPLLEQLAIDNTSFSNTSKLGGALQVTGTTWTIAGMVSHTAGIPLKVPGDGNKYNSQNFLPGAYTLGDVLSNNGYTNYFLLGSNAEFGGRKQYFKQHGNYKIYDYNWAKEKKLIDEDYHVWWGYEDEKLFSYAKDQLISISKKEKPFNFTMLTADTHFMDGYVEESCDTEKFDSQYANVFYCTDNMLSKFIDWIKEQKFYKDTVIIISGDHLTMQNEFYDNPNNKYTRTVYETIVNSSTTYKNNKNRKYVTMDMYPTTLAALGCQIENDRLGLGTNLYSSKKTLTEKLGYKNFNGEIEKNSKFYVKKLLSENDFYKLKDKERKNTNTK